VDLLELDGRVHPEGAVPSLAVVEDLDVLEDRVRDGGFCHPAFDDAMAEAGRLALTDPAEANAVWAELDRRLVKEAVWVPLGNPIKAYAFSER
jgi:hypothetical protein